MLDLITRKIRDDYKSEVQTHISSISWALSNLKDIAVDENKYIEARKYISDNMILWMKNIDIEKLMEILWWVDKRIERKMQYLISNMYALNRYQENEAQRTKEYAEIRQKNEELLEKWYEKSEEIRRLKIELARKNLPFWKRLFTHK